MSEEINRDDGFLRYYEAFKEEIGNIEQRLIDMQVSFDDAQRAHAAGVQNVYNEFKALTDGSLLLATKKQMNDMKSELMDFKRQLSNDIRFVKRCYKIVPSMAKIKELDDESYEKLVKILELVRT